MTSHFHVKTMKSCSAGLVLVETRHWAWQQMPKRDRPIWKKSIWWSWVAAHTKFKVMPGQIISSGMALCGILYSPGKWTLKHLKLRLSLALAPKNIKLGLLGDLSQKLELHQKLSEISDQVWESSWIIPVEFCKNQQILAVACAI